MSEITGISNIDNKNSYSANAVRKGTNSDFSSFLGESKSMDEIFDAAAKKYNVPSQLLKAVAKAESNFNASAVSRVGAQGVMQLMPATARELGVTNSFDAEQNIMGGAKYIATMLKKYNGDTKLALAAYNAGSGNVNKYNGIPPFKETQNYVKKVMNYYGQGNIEVASSANTQSSTSNNSANVSTNYTMPVSTPPLQRNLTMILTSSTDSDENSVGIDDLYSFFSYDDYMKFIDIFMEDEKEEEKRQVEEKENDYSNFLTTDINYNASVINLLSEQNLL